MLFRNTKIDTRTALLEVILIAVGVFAALAVDQWNDYRADRRLEADYLSRIHNDIQADLDMRVTWIGYMGRKINFLRIMVGEDSLEIDSSNVENFWNDFNLSMLYGLPALRSATIEEMVSTGRLALIQDTALRDSIAYYYAEYREWDEILTADAPRVYGRLVTEKMPYGLYYTSDVLRQFDPERIRNALETFRSDEVFLAAANSELNYAASIISSLRVLDSRTDQVLRLFE